MDKAGGLIPETKETVQVKIELPYSLLMDGRSVSDSLLPVCHFHEARFLSWLRESEAGEMSARRKPG